MVGLVKHKPPNVCSMAPLQHRELSSYQDYSQVCRSHKLVCPKVYICAGPLTFGRNMMTHRMIQIILIYIFCQSLN